MRPLIQLLIVIKPWQRWMLAGLLAGSLTIGSSIGLMMTSAYLIVSAGFHPSIAELQVAIVGVRFFGLARAAFRYLERIVTHEATFRILETLRIRLFSGIAERFTRIYSRLDSSELTSRLVSDIEDLQNFYLRVLLPPLTAALVIFILPFFFFFFAPLLAGILFICLAGSALILTATAWLTSRIPAVTLTRAGHSLDRAAADLVRGATEISMFDSAGFFRERYTAASREYARAMRRMQQSAAFTDHLAGLLSAATVFLSLLAVAELTSSGEVPGFMTAVVATAVIAAFEAIIPLADAIRSARSNIESARRILEISPLPQDNFPAGAALNGDTIRLQDVSFRYSGNRDFSLSGISLTINPGERIAVVGISGSGKTTLAGLLANLHQPQTGKITLGDSDYSQLFGTPTPAGISFATQSPQLFHDTIEANLWLGGAGGAGNSAPQTGLADFIESLPGKYRTFVGEFGHRLSGGQQQLLNVTRALNHKARLYIFDEPTTHLDRAQSQRIMAHIWQHRPAASTVVITHRIADTRAADRIYVIHDGRIIEEGLFDELLRQDGLFAALYRQQAEITTYLT